MLAGQRASIGDIEQPLHGPCLVQAFNSRVRQLRGVLSRLPWKWIALALCLATLVGAAYHYRHPLAQQSRQLELLARSQMADTKAYMQGPLYKKAHAWEHSLRQGLNHQRYGHAFSLFCACA